VSSASYTQPNAVSYCAGLALDGGGWRLPKVSELLTLVDPMRSAPAVDVAAFPAAPAANFWSATTYAGTPSGQVWYVAFYYGNVNRDVTTTQNLVRCVR